MAKLNKQQADAVRNAHQALDRLAVLPPGTPDTAEAREARQRRTELETAFPDAWPPDPPAIEIAGR